MDIKTNTYTPSPVSSFNAKGIASSSIDSVQVKKDRKVDNQQILTAEDKSIERKENEKTDHTQKVFSNEKKQDAEQVVAQLNKSIQSVQRNLSFSIDEDLEKVVINITDKETDEVVRQIPTEEALEMSKSLKNLLVDKLNDSQTSPEGVFFNSSV